MDLRAYCPADREACLEVFDSNTPRFFDRSERAGFESFLAAPMCSYFAMEHEGAIVACGGYGIEEDGKTASLVWGMVRADLHRRGLGRFMLLFRLREIGKTRVELVRVATSQHTAVFFQKQGFKAISVQKDGYAPGIDKIEMVMKLAVCV